MQAATWRVWRRMRPCAASSSCATLSRGTSRRAVSLQWHLCAARAYTSVCGRVRRACPSGVSRTQLPDSPLARYEHHVSLAANWTHVRGVRSSATCHACLSKAMLRDQTCLRASRCTGGQRRVGCGCCGLPSVRHCGEDRGDRRRWAHSENFPSPPQGASPCPLSFRRRAPARTDRHAGRACCRGIAQVREPRHRQQQAQRRAHLSSRVQAAPVSPAALRQRAKLERKLRSGRPPPRRALA